MFSCQECGVLNAQRQCSNCSAAIVEITETTHPNVTWDEVTNHLISRLKIDPEWMAKHVTEDEFTWWPWFLSQSFRVQTSGKYENSPDNWMRITATTRIARVDESLGLDLVTSATPEFPLGALIYSDGEILINTALLLNPLCRELLLWFHEAALAQATFAHELAMRWAEIDGVEILRSSHPTTGERTDPDELLVVPMQPTFYSTYHCRSKS